jgi:catechol 2,3-dioxygenase-like lactoylglutathione lyase family enzyme
MEAAWSIHHVNLPAHDVREAAAFYAAIFGMAEEPFQRPAGAGNFRSDAAALALFPQPGAASRGVNDGLHIVKPVPGFARDNALHHNPTIGGHVAITVPDLEAVKRRLDAAGVLYSDAGQYAMLGYRQIYLYDPSMNLIEVNQRVG